MKGETIGGRYELEELCGTGGMSTVWRAHDRLLDRKVAIKVLHPNYGEDDEYVERFRREARSVAQLSHPNIVTVIDRGEDAERQYIVFEFVEGENLKRLVERRGPLPIREVARIGLEIARGLAFAHERGLVHRDVKPQNVLLNGEGHAKVTDFGIARTLDVEKGVTQTGTVLGTSNYIAPEQASGERVDAQSDVYSLGCVLFELLTGDVPFPGESFVSVAMKHLNEEPPRVVDRRPDTPPRLAEVVERALAKDPHERLTMEELEAELEATLAELDGATVVVPRRRRRARAGGWGTRAPVALAAAGAAVVGVALAAAFAGSDEDNGAAAAPIRLVAGASYDPHGNDGTEHEDDVRNATDRDASTYWTTSSYRYGGGSLGKPGVGIVLTTSRSVELRAFRVTTDTPGFRAEIRVGGRRVSPSRTIGGTTTLPIRDGTRSRQWVLWITNLGPNSRAHVNEVRALAPN